MKSSSAAFTNTPQGKDDNYSWSEDSLLASDLLNGSVITLVVMANDLGGNAKSLYSIDDGNGNALTADFDLLLNDVTNGISAWEKTAASNWIRINNGEIEFKLDTSLSALGAADINALAAGDHVRDEFVYAIRLGNGTLSQARVKINIDGSNDAAVAYADTASATEAGGVDNGLPGLDATGNVLSNDTDADHDDTHTVTTTGNFTGSFGKLTLNADGSYSYALDNANTTVQALGISNDTLTDTFSYTMQDAAGAASTANLTVTIHGANDVAVIGGLTAGSVTEDNTHPDLTFAGALSITDVDNGQSKFTPADANGTYGVFTLAADGAWTYTADNSQAAIQQLGANQTLSDSFTAVSFDGSNSQTVTVTINGTNDAAVIGLPSVASVTEDANVANGKLVAAGTVSIADADLNQAQFQTVVTPAAGALGTLTLAANGSYTYSVANSAVQGLKGNETKVDTFTIKSVDGTAKDISFTINGAAEAARVQPHILFVDDDGGVTSNVTWTTTLQDLDYTFDVQTLAIDGNPTNLQNYDLVIWSVSDRAYSNLTAQNVSTLTSYLNGGGDLIYAGGHNLYDELAAASFIQNQLGLSNYRYNMPSVSGEAHLHASGPGGSYTLSDFSDNPGFTSVYGGTMMSAFNASIPTARVLMEITSGGAHAGHSGSANFDMANNDIAALNDTGTYRAATLGFDLNQLDQQFRSAFLDQVIQLVGGSPWDTVFAL